MKPFTKTLADVYIRIMVVNPTPGNDKFADDLATAFTADGIAWEKDHTAVLFTPGGTASPAGLSCNVSPEYVDAFTALARTLMDSEVIERRPIQCWTPSGKTVELYITEK